MFAIYVKNLHVDDVKQTKKEDEKKEKTNEFLFTLYH